MRCRVDGHSGLPAETSASCCGHACKHQWMPEFLVVALTLPDSPVKPGMACHAAADRRKRPRTPISTPPLRVVPPANSSCHAVYLSPSMGATAVNADGSTSSDGLRGAVMGVASDSGLLAQVADGQHAVGDGWLTGEQPGECLVEAFLGRTSFRPTRCLAYREGGAC